MSKEHSSTPRPFAMPPEAPHKNLRRRFGAAAIAGCLTLSMCPTLALAQPNDSSDPFNPNNQAMQSQLSDNFGAPQQGGEFAVPFMQQLGAMGGNQDIPGLPGQQPGEMPANMGGEQGAPDQQPSKMPSDMGGEQNPFGQQPGDIPADTGANQNAQGFEGQQPGEAPATDQMPQNQPGQLGQQAPTGQEQQGQQPEANQQGQAGQPGDNGMQAPIMPEQVREIVERIYDILNIDKEANPIEHIMGVLGYGMQHIAQAPNALGGHLVQPAPMEQGNPMGQPDQGTQPAPMGQPGQSSQPGQPGSDQQGQQGQQPESGQPAQQGNNQQGGQPESSQPGQMGEPGGNMSAPTSFDAANTPDSSADGVSYESTAGSENAVLVDGKTLTLSNATVTKTGDTSGENADFYGTNAAILANNGANLTITDATVTTDGTHANGVFSYGTGTSVSISDSTITTSGNNSGGLMTTGGASLTATNMTVSTSGNSSAAIRTDRGGGTVTATQGTYETTGVSSPAIYSTADITVSDATLSATNSEAVVIEGGNSVTLNNATVTGSNAKLNGQSTVKTNVLIYQSMSGDASEGASNFTMTDGSLTALTGCMFHVTNTTTTIDLTNVALTNAADSNDFLIATADAWGTSGKNGGHATVNLTSQTVNGNITVDSVSSVALNLTGSSYTGAIANEGTVNVTMDASSTWTLTGDSYITSLSGDTSGINLNGYTLYVNGVAYNG